MQFLYTSHLPYFLDVALFDCFLISNHKCSLTWKKVFNDLEFITAAEQYLNDQIVVLFFGKDLTKQMKWSAKCVGINGEYVDWNIAQGHSLLRWEAIILILPLGKTDAISLEKIVFPISFNLISESMNNLRQFIDNFEKS